MIYWRPLRMWEGLLTDKDSFFLPPLLNARPRNLILSGLKTEILKKFWVWDQDDANIYGIPKLGSIMQGKHQSYWTFLFLLEFSFLIIIGSLFFPNNYNNNKNNRQYFTCATYWTLNTCIFNSHNIYSILTTTLK